MASLTPALVRVARYASDNPDKVIYHTVTELAEASGASEASVIRFCRDLGYSGFQEFKLALAVDLASKPQERPTAPADSPRSDLELVVRHALTAVSDTGELLDEADITTAARRLLAASRVDLYGSGASGIVAQYFEYKLIRLGVDAHAHQDPHLAAMSASRLGRKDVAIGISSSGSIVDTVHSLNTAATAGAFTIAVTNRPKSPLTKHADLVLLSASPESPLTGGAIPSKISQLVVLEALATVMLHLQPSRDEAIRDTAEAVVDKSY